MNNHSHKPQTFVMFFLLASYSVAIAQPTTGEQRVIEAQIDAFFASWNNHEFSDMRNYMGKDCDFINIVGMHWKGREDVQYAHQATHEKIFKDIPLEKRAVSIRFVKPDVAIAHVLMHPLKTFITPDGSTAGENDALATFVFVKSNGVWLVEAVENVVVDEKAKPFNPVTMRDNQNKHK